MNTWTGGDGMAAFSQHEQWTKEENYNFPIQKASKNVFGFPDGDIRNGCYLLFCLFITSKCSLGRGYFIMKGFVRSLISKSTKIISDCLLALLKPIHDRCLIKPRSGRYQFPCEVIYTVAWGCVLRQPLCATFSQWVWVVTHFWSHCFLAQSILSHQTHILWYKSKRDSLASNHSYITTVAKQYEGGAAAAYGPMTNGSFAEQTCW